MGATEDRINHLIQTREEAKRWLVARLRTTPEPLDDFDEDATLNVLLEELADGDVSYTISLHLNEDGFRAASLEDIAEQLLVEVAEVLKVIRRERRLLDSSPPDDELTGDALLAALNSNQEAA